eukprot:5447534-Amphidinium_carterae.1
MEHPGPAQETIRWILDRDRHTRAKARSLHIDGSPWCEALRVARETHLAVAWTSTSIGVSSAAPRQIMATDLHSQGVLSPRAPPARQGDSMQSSTPSCSAFNSTSGCTQKQRDCPHRARHACSFIKPDGTPCGNWQHSALRCPLNPQRSKASKGSSKGASKKD